MQTKDLKPGKTPGWWTAEELKPQLSTLAWQELVDHVSLNTTKFKQGNVYKGEPPVSAESVNFNKRPDFSLSAYDLDVFFAITGH